MDWKKTSRLRFRRSDGYAVVKNSKTWFAKDQDGTWIKYDGDNASYFGRRKQWRISQNAMDWIDQEFAIEDLPVEPLPLTFGGGMMDVGSKPTVSSKKKKKATGAAPKSYVFNTDDKASIKINCGEASISIEVNGSKVAVHVDVGS